MQFRFDPSRHHDCDGLEDVGSMFICVLDAGQVVVDVDAERTVQSTGDVGKWNEARLRVPRDRPGQAQAGVCVRLPRAEVPAGLAGRVLPGDSPIGALVASMVRQITELPVSASRQSSLHLQSSLLHLVLASLDEDARAPGTRLDGAKQYMQQRLDDLELSPLKVARHLGISLRSLARLFAAEDSTPSRWLWSARLAKARQLLETGSARNVTDVALACGFTSFSHFSRAFRQVHGVPPSALRAPRRGTHQGLLSRA